MGHYPLQKMGAGIKSDLVLGAHDSPIENPARALPPVPALPSATSLHNMHIRVRGKSMGLNESSATQQTSASSPITSLEGRVGVQLAAGERRLGFGASERNVFGYESVRSLNEERSDNGSWKAMDTDSRDSDDSGARSSAKTKFTGLFSRLNRSNSRSQPVESTAAASFDLQQTHVQIMKGRQDYREHSVIPSLPALSDSSAASSPERNPQRQNFPHSEDSGDDMTIIGGPSVRRTTYGSRRRMGGSFSAVDAVRLQDREWQDNTTHDNGSVSSMDPVVAGTSVKRPSSGEMLEDPNPPVNPEFPSAEIEAPGSDSMFLGYSFRRFPTSSLLHSALLSGTLGDSGPAGMPSDIGMARSGELLNSRNVVKLEYNSDDQRRGRGRPKRKRGPKDEKDIPCRQGFSIVDLVRSSERSHYLSREPPETKKACPLWYVILLFSVRPTALLIPGLFLSLATSCSGLIIWRDIFATGIPAM